MPWTPPMTAAPEEEFTANEFNTHVRDNLIDLDTRVTGNSNVLDARKYVGATILKLRRAETQSIADNVDVPVQWDTEDLDVFDGWVVTNPTIYIVKVTGWYEISFSPSFVGNTSGVRQCSIQRNSTSLPGAFTRALPSPVGSQIRPIQPRTNSWLLEQNDELVFIARQNSGGSLNLTGDTPASSYVTMKFVSPDYSG